MTEKPFAITLEVGSSLANRTGNWRQRYYDARNLFLLLSMHKAVLSDSRSKYESWFWYCKHVYYSYCLEKEQRCEQAANAVVQGISDAISGRFGPWAIRRPLDSRLIWWLLEAAWRWRGSKAQGSV